MAARGAVAVGAQRRTFFYLFEARPPFAILAVTPRLAFFNRTIEYATGLVVVASGAPGGAPGARGGRVVEEGVRDMRQQDVLVGMGVDDCEVRHVRLALCHQVLRRLHWREPLRPEHARARALCKPSKKAG